MLRSKQFYYFLGAGGVAAAANFGSRFVFSRWMGFESAVLCAFVVGLAVGFSLMRAYVFDTSDESPATQLGWFVTVNLLAIIQTLAISVLLARWLLPAVGVHTYAQAAGHLVGVITPVVTSYYGHRFLTFR
jgi:putative flippase GtrA